MAGPRLEEGVESAGGAEAPARPRGGDLSFGVFAGLVAFPAAYFFVSGYPVLRVASLLWPEWAPGTGYLLAIFCLPAAGWLVHQHWRNALTRFVLRVAYTWLGLLFLAAVTVAAWDVGRWLLGPRLFGVAGLVMVLAGVLPYALFGAHRLVIRRFQVRGPVPSPIRMVQVSDIHVGSRTGRFLNRVVERVNRARPDRVFITGDLVDLAGLSPEVLVPLSGLEAPAYFVIGNHERYVDADAICRQVAEQGVRVLRNEATVDGALQIIGIDDASGRDQVERVLGGIPVEPGCYPVLLYHRPDGLEAAAERGVRLMLCGHTHNGQILPFNFLVKRVFWRICGLYQHGLTRLYVSPGTGTWGPMMRLGSVNEITVIDLVPEA